MPDIPDNLVIELRRTPSVEFEAQSTHVTNIPVGLHQDPPVVVQTFGRGSTPRAALDCLLDNILRGESNALC